jgi:hypothetical protein
MPALGGPCCLHRKGIGSASGLGLSRLLCVHFRCGPATRSPSQGWLLDRLTSFGFPLAVYRCCGASGSSPGGSNFPLNAPAFASRTPLPAYPRGMEPHPHHRDDSRANSLPRLLDSAFYRDLLPELGDLHPLRLGLLSQDDERSGRNELLAGRLAKIHARRTLDYNVEAPSIVGQKKRNFRACVV